MFKHVVILTTLLLSMSFSTVMADENITIVVPTSEAAEGLDLYAVSELFKDTANLEDFEEGLNNPEYGINNLDLDGNGYVDFIRVVEEVIDGTHIIILQAAIGENEFQDVATIQVERTGSDYNMHVHGNEVIYGTNYYIAPSHVRINFWPIIAWIYRPIYHPYHSAFYWQTYPRWWRPYRPIHINDYHGRTHRYTKRNAFVISRTARVRTVTRVKYQPRTSARVTRHVGYNKTNKRLGKTTTNRVGVQKTNYRKNGTTTVKNGVSRTTRNQYGNKTTVKKGVSKTTRNQNGNYTTVKKGTSKTTRNQNGNYTTVKKSASKTTRNQNGKNTTVKNGNNKTNQRNGKSVTVKKTKKTTKSKDDKEVSKKKSQKSQKREKRESRIN